jgi:L-alanine-DL-glutamate epimerase-like enolase superfamily enzyme
VELVTVRLRDSDGAEGVGYTYTTRAGGAAAHALIDQGLRPVLLGADADQIEALWTRMWWKLHDGGRGGSVSLAVSACDIVLHDLKARRLGVPLWRMPGGFAPEVPCFNNRHAWCHAARRGLLLGGSSHLGTHQSGG